jgi:hypothetical protein
VISADVRAVVREWLVAERRPAVDAMRITRSRYASSSTLLNVHCTLTGGERLRLVYKEVAPTPAIAPAFIADPGREAWVYASVLAKDGIADAPQLLAAGVAREGGCWLLMEWAGSVDLGQVGSPTVWAEVAARLARLHEWGAPRLDALSRGVRWDDPALHMRWAERARSASPTPDPLAALWDRYDVVAERIAAMPKTLVHGDFNASNVLVTRSASGPRVRFIDWETAGVGPGLLDLASLTSGRLPERHHSAVVAAYRATLAVDDFDEALAWCRLALAVKWLGWSPGWSAPAAHDHDWRAEALGLSIQLGLVGRR